MATKKKVSKKLMVTKEATTVSTYDFEGKLDSVIERLNAYRAEYGPTARLDFSSHGFIYYCDSPGYAIYIDREETEEECEKRILDEQHTKNSRETHERQEFERLKKKFETN